TRVREVRFRSTSTARRKRWRSGTRTSSRPLAGRRWYGSIGWPRRGGTRSSSARRSIRSAHCRTALPSPGSRRPSPLASSNTGIGLAMVCAAKGYPLVLIQAEPFSVERRKLMRFLGAKVVVTPAPERAVGMINKMEELAAKHGWFMTRQFENEANPDYHSRTTAREILDDFAGDRLDYWGHT